MPKTKEEWEEFRKQVLIEINNLFDDKEKGE